MKKRISIIFIIFIQIVTASAQQISLKSEGLNLNLSAKGQITALSNPVSGKNYLAIGEKAPLLQVRIGSDWYQPTEATFKSGIITLIY